jgi:multicomponent Na+:H+ antiporter subunit F
MTAITTVALVVLGVAGVVAVLAVVRGTDLVDRAVALDVALLVVVDVLIVLSVRWGDGALLDLVLLVGLLGFVSGLTVARYVERRGP